MSNVSGQPFIRLRGVRHNNLKNFDLDLPLHRLIVITGDRGLCGSLNANAIRAAARVIVEVGVPVDCLAIGRRGRDWLARHGSNLVAEVTGLSGFELKSIMRTGTVASIDNRNWELAGPAIVRRLSQSRAVALDMESAAIAANGFRFRVPYGTLLCVSDKPLHGEIKLAGMAGEFYRQRVGQHLEIGLRALEELKSQARERLHSRKLRSFTEVAFQ